MGQMKMLTLGVLFLALCFSVQVCSQNTTNSWNQNMTSSGVNTTGGNPMSSATNTTSPPNGGATFVRSGGYIVLLPLSVLTLAMGSHC